VESGGGEEVGKRDTTSYPDTIESHPRVSLDLPKPKGIGLVWGTMLRSHAYIPYFFLY
jgi:hypothetical protein